MTTQTSLPTHPFIVFEGGEGSGKSTQVRMLTDALHGAGHEVLVTREPGGSSLGREIRRLLLDPSIEAIHPRTEALLFAADRAEHVATVIRPALESGSVVVSDRYMDSSAAYQGARSGLSRSEVRDLSLWAADSLVPLLTVVLDLDPRVGLRRASTHEFGVADRFESETLEFLEAVRNGFLDLAAQHPDRYLVVDATRPADEVAMMVWETVQGVLQTSISAPHG